jgi:hypothetical protein
MTYYLINWAHEQLRLSTLNLVYNLYSFVLLFIIIIIIIIQLNCKWVYPVAVVLEKEQHTPFVSEVSANFCG